VPDRLILFVDDGLVDDVWSMSAVSMSGAGWNRSQLICPDARKKPHACTGGQAAGFTISSGENALVRCRMSIEIYLLRCSRKRCFPYWYIRLFRPSSGSEGRLVNLYVRGRGSLFSLRTLDTFGVKSGVRRVKLTP
jgi:hypothetical protein